MTDSRTTANQVFVYIEIEGRLHFLGYLWINTRGRRETATFEYARTWLKSPAFFALEPAVSAVSVVHHAGSGYATLGAIGDSAPDRWGRMLMRRAERKAAKSEGRAPRTLREIDYLLGVNDEIRLGALRFALNEGGPFLAESTEGSIPPLIHLPQLLAASDRLLQDKETWDDLSLLVAPGSSLGGAQPKASVQEGSQLYIAKFPNRNDDHNRIIWEAVALDLAEKSGIRIPEHRVTQVNGKDVLIVKRFDRISGVRIPFLSGMSMISARDNEVHSYLELADRIRSQGAFPKRDLLELWRRIVFTVLISNVDDHMRNHGFLYSGNQGWTLSPAYDLNPTPVDLSPRILSTAIDIDDQTASIELANEVAGYFELGLSEARDVMRRTAQAVCGWRKAAERYGLSPDEIDRMSSAFEHDDLKMALGS